MENEIKKEEVSQQSLVTNYTYAIRRMVGGVMCTFDSMAEYLASLAEIRQEQS